MSDLVTLRLDADAPGVARAAEILAEGGLVAFPTETVYGLGADAANDRAVARIYEAKGRPSFNPLIVHLSDIEAVQRLVVWSEPAERVAQAFWPGPLTMVLPLREDARVSRLVTAGLDTLAVRLPANPTARALLNAFDGPVAAPSANPSGRISPTRAAHVLEGLDGKIEAVLDGGRCGVGLESTILGLTGKPTILRPGRVTSEDLGRVLGRPVLERKDRDKISAPGQLASHYAPRARVRLNAAEWREGEARLGFGDEPCDLNLSRSGDLVEAAANLFEYLHRLDASNAEVIAVAPIPHVGLGVAINDRLSRAAAPRETP
ncbi:L-threonylcarbamoyladenylate synthase [Salipiger mucosus]|uniref:Threonylcarbamoyl-AMP synthase n=1 Tax=Salipiger mucosus DSM 16094 TaxID=1123237 RepID=S9Q5D2_9RHOB|nr:L-threonylcarbamoyladenylate synthase [Salipiger mucosus]EPX76551.1 YrdC/Sua5 family protein, required for threonylcarbamoyladenosine (t(6)A) formation in tRNA [Salipiger mucosus DSM 16094]